MLPNEVTFAVSALLAASFFLLPALYKPVSRLQQVLIVAALYIVVFAAFLMLYNMQSAVAIVVLSAVFSGICEVLAINFRQVRSARHPKHRRCY